MNHEIRWSQDFPRTLPQIQPLMQDKFGLEVRKATLRKVLPPEFDS